MKSMTPTAGMMRPLMMEPAPATSPAAPPTTNLKMLYTVTSVERLSKKSESRQEKSPLVGLSVDQKAPPHDVISALGFAKSLTYDMVEGTAAAFCTPGQR